MYGFDYLIWLLRMVSFYLEKDRNTCPLFSFSSRCRRIKFPVNISRYHRLSAPSTFVVVLFLRVPDYWECKLMFVKDSLVRNIGSRVAPHGRSALVYIERWKSEMILRCSSVYSILLIRIILFYWRKDRYTYPLPSFSSCCWRIKFSVIISKYLREDAPSTFIVIGIFDYRECKLMLVKGCLMGRRVHRFNSQATKNRLYGTVKDLRWF